METENLTSDDDTSVPLNSISDLCAYLSVSYSTVFVPCNFCNSILSSLECVFFDQAECKLLWKEGLAFGVCHYCLRLLARFEFIAFNKGAITVRQFEQACGRSLHTYCVRCLTCLRRFQPAEIEAAVSQNVTLHVVGRKLRIKCAICELGL